MRSSVLILAVLCTAVSAHGTSYAQDYNSTAAATTVAAVADVSTVYVTVCATSTPSAAPVPSAASNGSIGTTIQPSPATFTGAASHVAAGLGSMAVAGVLALFL